LNGRPGRCLVLCYVYGREEVRWLEVVPNLRLVPTVVRLGLVFLVAPAMCHGAADWIRANPATSSCCGPTDCAPLPDGQVVEERNGWFVVPFGQHFKQGDPIVFPSTDNRYWACRYPGQGVRCFFYPQPAT
jgi:hypothetical protein